jgi:deoxycytidylate deaminase
MNIDFPSHFRFAIASSRKSVMEQKVGACLVVGKSILKGHNKEKTHRIFANPDIHVRLSLHAELDCLIKAGMKAEGGEIFVYREVHGKPAIAKPCEHCIPFLKEAGVETIYYSTSHFPFWKKEAI